MAPEIERKFLVKDTSMLFNCSGSLIEQGYICHEPVVRFRKVTSSGGNETAYITIKGPTTGITREEVEAEVDTDDFFKFCGPVLKKTRYNVKYKKRTWEVDVFHGRLQGLILAECEMRSEDEEVILPEWLGQEVSSDSRYYNSNLIGKTLKDLS